MRRVGLIGCGGIGGPIVRALRAGHVPYHVLGAVLARTARSDEGVAILDDPDAFFGHALDLIIEAAGPEAFRAYVPRALGLAEVWAVSPTALANPVVEMQVRVALRGGHRLRVLPGALVGLDGVRTATAGGLLALEVTVDVAPTVREGAVLFEGTAREAALRFPHHVNVAVAAALAGPGLDATWVRVCRPSADAARTLRVRAHSAVGTFEAIARPRVVRSEGIHPVAASILGALHQTDAPLWVG